MLICLFFTVRSNEDTAEDETEPNCDYGEKECKDFEKTNGYNCCWAKGKFEGQETKGCIPIKMDDFQKKFDELEKDVKDLSVDCSGKYLYVASLLMLLFVF